jgi:hypothetical protein
MKIRAGELRQHSTWEQMLVPLVAWALQAHNHTPSSPGQRTLRPSP